MSKKSNRNKQRALEEQRQREELIAKNRRKGWIMLAVVVAMAILTAVAFNLGGILFDLSTNMKGTPLVEEGGEVNINAHEVTDEFQFQTVSVDGMDVEIIMVRASDGGIRTAINTCEGCYASGNGRFTAEGNELVCENCGDRFTADEIGLSSTLGAEVTGQPMDGPCYPYPITSSDRFTDSNEIRISYDYLSSAVATIRSWGETS